MKNQVFWIFGALQSFSPGNVMFLLFRLLSRIIEESVIGLDARVRLRFTFRFFLLGVECPIRGSCPLKVTKR
ncbi:hypothetical protein KGY64_07820 [Candidatus Bipolaricaulota bacterium]|nr:hypothetical protein [Candidatus Bipolaricaulota bacterium]